jgi:hypothetical protein
MAMKKRTPEEREELRSMRAETLASTHELQEARDNLREKRRAVHEQRTRRRALVGCFLHPDRT